MSHVNGSTRAEGVSDEGDKEDVRTYTYNGGHEGVRNCTELHDLYCSPDTAEPGYNDNGLSDTPPIASDILY